VRPCHDCLQPKYLIGRYQTIRTATYWSSETVASVCCLSLINYSPGKDVLGSISGLTAPLPSEKRDHFRAIIKIAALSLFLASAALFLMGQR
jgi:hypothetical protein